MSISISSALSNASIAAAANSSSTSAVPLRNQQPTIQTTNDSADTVRLTEAQQVAQLYTQGQPVTQIAANLSLTVSAVNSYLGISTSS